MSAAGHSLHVQKSTASSFVGVDSNQVKPRIWMEADSVATSAGSLARDFVWSLAETDILSGWTKV
jgi:hypothetical protein